MEFVRIAKPYDLHLVSHSGAWRKKKGKKRALPSLGVLPTQGPQLGTPHDLACSLNAYLRGRKVCRAKSKSRIQCSETRYEKNLNPFFSFLLFLFRSFFLRAFFSSFVSAAHPTVLLLCWLLLPLRKAAVSATNNAHEETAWGIGGFGGNALSWALITRAAWTVAICIYGFVQRARSLHSSRDSQLLSLEQPSGFNGSHGSLLGYLKGPPSSFSRSKECLHDVSQPHWSKFAWKFSIENIIALVLGVKKSQTSSFAFFLTYTQRQNRDRKHEFISKFVPIGSGREQE